MLSVINTLARFMSSSCSFTPSLYMSVLSYYLVRMVFNS